jgi:hypothetical protein
MLPAAVAPAQTLTDKEYQRLRDASLAIIREMGVECGGSNVQMAINPVDGERGGVFRKLDVPGVVGLWVDGALEPHSRQWVVRVWSVTAAMCRGLMAMPSTLCPDVGLSCLRALNHMTKQSHRALCYDTHLLLYYV